MADKRPAYSQLVKDIRAGKFVLTGELEPEKVTGLEEVLVSARAMKPYVVAANVTDNPLAYAYMNSLVPSWVVQKEVGLETVYQMTVRDRNRLALTSDILAASYLGIKNILAISGDHTVLGDNKGAVSVYDLDSAQFVYLLHKMIDEGVDVAGNEIHGNVEINVGIAANPNADPLMPEVLKVGRKTKIGADFIQTQTMFDIDKTKEFLKEAEKYKCPTLIGVFPLKSYGIADFFDRFIPGVSVPKELLASMKKVKEEPDKEKRSQLYDEVNLEFFRPFIKEIRKTTSAAGIHVMAVMYERIFEPLLEAF
ncbi:MAG TPA: methylenetetrahydrofolate reductase [Candidatus Krumholzibacteriaceae bacterium]|nr:methylenetetrahydrofolate reductase [Candidatus Krumholzibacteriaceae bacterium]